MAEIKVFNRMYQLRRNDIFCVDVKTFLKTSTLWHPSYQIVGITAHKRKHWWQLWKPKKMVFIRIMYLGDGKDEQNSTH